MNIVRIQVGDVLHLKKPHPCSSCDFIVRRVGSMVRIVCLGCGRDMDVDRVKLEKAIKSITPAKPDQTQGKDLSQ